MAFEGLQSRSWQRLDTGVARLGIRGHGLPEDMYTEFS